MTNLNLSVNEINKKTEVDFHMKVQAESEEAAWQEIYDMVMKLAGFEQEESTEETEEEETEEETDEEESEEEEEEEEAPKPKLSKEIPSGYYDVSKVSALTGITPPNISMKMTQGTFPRPDSKHGLKNIWLVETIKEYLHKSEAIATSKTVTVSLPPKADEPEEVKWVNPVLIDLERVSQMTGLDEDTIDLLIANDRFPDTAEGGEGKWLESDIKEYLEKRKKRA